MFDYEVGFFPSSYLRLTLGGNPRALTFWDLVSKKIHKRLAMWKKRFFSKASKLILITLVLRGRDPTVLFL